LMPEPYRSRHDGYIAHHLDTGERKIIGIGRQVMGLRKSGTIFPIHLSVSAVESDGRRYFTGIIIDLSDHQNSTNGLREQALIQAIFNNLPDAVLVTDTDGRVLLCNPAVGRVFGYAPEELIGQPTSVLYETARECRRRRRAYASGRCSSPWRSAIAASRARAFPPRRSSPSCAIRAASSRVSSRSTATSASRWSRTRPCASPSAWRRSAS